MVAFWIHATSWQKAKNTRARRSWSVNIILLADTVPGGITALFIGARGVTIVVKEVAFLNCPSASSMQTNITGNT